MFFAYDIDLTLKRDGRSTFKHDKEIYLSFIYIVTSIITDYTRFVFFSMYI